MRVMPPAGEETRCLTVMDRNPASRCLGPKPATAITRRRRKSRAEWQPREAGEVTASQGVRRVTSGEGKASAARADVVAAWWGQKDATRSRGPYKSDLDAGAGFLSPTVPKSPEARGAGRAPSRSQRSGGGAVVSSSLGRPEGEGEDARRGDRATPSSFPR